MKVDTMDQLWLYLAKNFNFITASFIIEKYIHRIYVIFSYDGAHYTNLDQDMFIAAQSMELNFMKLIIQNKIQIVLIYSCIIAVYHSLMLQ